MRVEMDSPEQNITYELVKLAHGWRVLKNKWVFKMKPDKLSGQPRYKARLVVKGFS